MSLTPFNWSVVITGRWNPSILTPGRISEKIFGLPKGQGIEVLVPIDGISPYQIRHPKQNITFIPNNERLQIGLGKMNLETLGHAMNAGVKVLEWLPETPVSAAGFNVCFHTTSPDATELSILANKYFDDSVSDLGQTIMSRQIIRSLAHGEGVVNITLSSDKPDYFEISCNFHRASTVTADLIKWLKTSPSDINLYMNGLFEKLKFAIEEETNVGNTEKAD
jgi:hypothetical protein